MSKVRYGKLVSARMVVLALFLLGTLPATAAASTVALTGVKASPGNQSVTAGQATPIYGVTVMFGNGGPGGGGGSIAVFTISAATPLPAGTTATFTPSSVTATAAGNQTSTLTISTLCGTTPPGIYTFTVTATGIAGDDTGTVKTSGNETLTVNSCAPTLNNINVSPAQNSVVASRPSPNYIATVSFKNPSPPGGGSDTVTLSIAPPLPFPTGTTVTLFPTSVTGTGNPAGTQTSTLSITVPCGTPTENLNFTMRASDDAGITKYSNALTLKVNAAVTCATPTATPTVSISGAAIQNGMNGAAITAVSVNPNGYDASTLGAATADGNGQFSMVIGAQNGPVRFRASGGTYVSEQNGATISSPSPLSALLPNLEDNLSGLSINPLTTFVDSMARGNITRGQDLATALSDSTASIEQDYNISTDPSTLTPLCTAAAGGTDSGRLGLILGAIVNEDQLACASAPGGLVTALSSDISDGVFDGTKSGAVVSYCGGSLAAIAGTAQFSDALSGLQELTLATSGFTFGGTLNELTLNGVTASDVAADAAMIEEALVATAPPSVNTFATTTPSMNARRAAATATQLPNDKVLIAGGVGNGGSLSSTDLYDPVTDTFAAITPVMNAARAYAAATLLPNGKVLIAGGQTTAPCCSVPILNSTELYDPATNTFAASTPVMNSARFLATATLLPNGLVLIAGGYNFGSNHTVTYFTNTELYDPLSNTFAVTPPVMNAGRAQATATLLSNGKVLIAGGYGNAGLLTSTELYDPVNNTFAAPVSTPAMNTARYAATATLLPNGKVLIAGGGTDQSLSSTELYDPVTNTFAASTPAMNTGRQNATATLLPNGKVLIAGGDNVELNGFDSPLESTELYDPATNTFAASTPFMNDTRSLATATLLPNGKVLIAGGGGIFAIFSGLGRELYTP